MRSHILPVAALALTLAACEAAAAPSAASPSPHAAASLLPAPTASTSSSGAASGEPARPLPTATAPAGTGPGTWVAVKGDAYAELPVAAVAAGGRVVVLDAAPLCYFPEDDEGTDPVPWPPTAWVFTPADGRFRRSAELVTVRTGFAVAPLPDGRVLVVGGWNDEGVPNSSTRIWSARTGQWSEGPLMTVARAEPVAVALADGRVMVMGGMTPSLVYVARTEIYDPDANGWSRTGSLPGPNQVASAVRLATGEVLAVALTDLDGAPAIVWLYDPESGTWDFVDDPPRTVGQPVALPDGSVLFFGGDRKVLRFDPDDGWSEAGRLLTARAGAAIALLEDGRVLLAGGRAGDPAKGTAKAVKTAELFDPTTGTSAKAASLPRPRLDAAAVRLGDGSVLVAGGVEDAFNGGTPWCPTIADRAFRWVP